MIATAVGDFFITGDRRKKVNFTTSLFTMIPLLIYDPKNDKIDKEQDQKKMYKLRKRRVNMWGKHYRHPINRLPEDIEAKIDENLL